MSTIIIIISKTHYTKTTNIIQSSITKGQHNISSTYLGLSHISAVLSWIPSIHYHSTYISNYTEQILSPQGIISLSSIPYSIYSQDLLSAPGLNSVGSSELVLLTLGHISSSSLSTSASQLLILSLIIFLSSLYLSLTASISQYITKKLNTMTIHQLSILLGLSSISWSGHIYHISTPVHIVHQLYPEGLSSHSISDLLFLSPILLLLSSPSIGISPISTSISPLTTCYHHLGLGICLILGPTIYFLSKRHTRISSISFKTGNQHLVLCIILLFLSLISIAWSYLLVSLSTVYSYLSIHYESVLGLSVHHIWIGSASLLGSASHLSIYAVSISSNQYLISQRDLIIRHLSWITVFLGTHSFGLYIHNDTMYALGTNYYTISDSGIHLSPIFVNYLLNISESPIVSISNKIAWISSDFSTSDYLTYHIHTFTFHITLLIVFKGLLYSRTSRLIPDKQYLGFSYPCDGPGRGGTCQVSPWDHIYLGSFWAYNSCSILVFSISWLTSSYLWGTISLSIVHLTNGDYTTSLSISNWLRDYLWSQSSQSIQTYGSASLCQFGLVFIGSHFFWALSLMFLFSGRGYWQELIESLIWTHTKLKVIQTLSPQALSITHGRLSGAVHYIVSGIFTTYAYLLPRIIVLST